MAFSKITNDTEPNGNYVRVLDPKAHEISFVRTPCHSHEVLYVSCENLECGMQSGIGIRQTPGNLGKMAAPGDWPWYVALFRADTHVCDGSLVCIFKVFLKLKIIKKNVRFRKIGSLPQTHVSKDNQKRFGWQSSALSVSHQLLLGLNVDESLE